MVLSAHTAHTLAFSLKCFPSPPGRAKRCFLCALTAPSPHLHQTISYNNDRFRCSLGMHCFLPPEFQEGQGCDLLFIP